MTTNYVRIKQHWTVAKSFEHIRRFGRTAETVNVIYVADKNEKLIDDLRLNQLILAEPDTLISDIMDNTFVALSAFDDQEEAVCMLSKYGGVVLLVDDSGGILAC